MDSLVDLGTVSADTNAFCRGTDRDGMRSNQCTPFWVWHKAVPDPTKPIEPAPPS